MRYPQQVDTLVSTWILAEINFKHDKDLIMKYRSIATYPEVDMAIEDICNEAITDESGVIVKLNLDNLDQADNVKDLIMEEFDRILKLN